MDQKVEQDTKPDHPVIPENTPPDTLKKPTGGKFGTFNGVFRPTILTIIGVMMYLREGWLVGNAGLLGAVLVILMAYCITGTTALSLSSITTNIRVGSGGVFSIISQSLGLEVGGSIGIPLYLAQGLSAAMYMHGFIETWLYIFPGHPYILVMLALFVVAMGLSYISAGLAFRAQYVVMAGVVAALVSMFAGLNNPELPKDPVMWGGFEDGSFWMLFAVFFPAATGIMVGSSLSGDLKNPRKSIPLGTMAAWLVSFIIYLSVAVWYSLVADPTTLRDTSRVLAAEMSAWGPAVLLGVMASCFSATLSSVVAAPRVLQSLASHKIVPWAKFFEKTHNGEPRNAILFTGVIVLASLLLGDLNTIAKILTVFFLTCYFTINSVLVLETSLDMISFRPQFRIPIFIPILGSLVCFVAIVIINPIMGLFALAFCLGLYLYLNQKQLDTPWETVHSGLFGSIANWAARKVFHSNTKGSQKSWKPDLLVPIERHSQLEGYFRFVRSLTWSQGSVQVVAISSDEANGHFEELPELIGDFQREGLFASHAVIKASNFINSLNTCMSVMNGSFFKPNTIFTSIEHRTQEELQAIVDMAQTNRMGVLFLANYPDTGLGRERVVNLWVRDQSPNWQLTLNLANLDYAVLLSYQLKKNWQATIRLLCVVEQPENVTVAKDFLSGLIDAARMAGNIDIQVHHGQFMEFLDHAPRADLDIFGLSVKVNKKGMETLMAKSRSSCLFVLDSGVESALA